jgi:hypothetical protein
LRFEVVYTVCSYELIYDVEDFDEFANTAVGNYVENARRLDTAWMQHAFHLSLQL